MLGRKKLEFDVPRSVEVADGVLIQAQAELGASKTVADYADAINRAAFGDFDNGAGAAGNLPGDIAGVIAKIQNAQVSSPSQSPERSTCPAGCIVETACL